MKAKDWELNRKFNGTLTPEQLSARWGVSVGTLANWRVETVNKGPKFIKNFGKVLYRVTDIKTYERQNNIIPVIQRPTRSGLDTSSPDNWFYCARR